MNQFQRAKATPEELAAHDAGVKARASAYQKKWAKENAGKRNSQQNARRAANPERTRAHEVKYRKNNVMKLRQRSKDYAKAHPDEIKIRFKRYYEKTKAIRHEEWACKDALRRGCIIGDRSLIIPMYEYAVEMQRRTGIRWSVDHIIPLALGGPHSAENMQPMELVMNHTKSGNPFWICEDGKYKDWRSVPSCMWPDKFVAIFNEVVANAHLGIRLKETA